MKQLFLILALYSLGLQAQEGFKIGLNGGIPVSGETNDAVSLVIGADLGYMVALGEVVDAGVLTGFINGFPEKYDSGGIDLPNVQFLPIAGSIRIWPSNAFSFGADLGYALGINEGNQGGFYYKPILGYLMGPRTEVNVSYTGIGVEGFEWATLNIGFLYTFPDSLRR